MELRELRYLLAVAEEGSFTRAAARCFVTQQALSHGIATLERHLGVRLLHRHPKGAVLTPDGARLAASARPLVEQADRIARELRAAVPPGEVRVAMMLDGLGPMTVPLLRELRRALPEATVTVMQLHPSEIGRALVEGSADVALAQGPVLDERLVSVPVRLAPRLAVVSAADERAYAPELHAADVVDLAARARGVGIDPGWDAFFLLAEQRGGEEPERRGSPPRSMEELLYSIGLDQLFLTVPDHTRDTYPGHAYGVRYIPLVDVAPVPLAVVHRATDPPPAALTLARLTRLVA